MDGSSRKVQNASAHSINLRTTKAHSQFNGALDESSRNVQNVSAHIEILHTNKARSRQFSGAMEEMSGKVQNANTHILRRHIHEHAHSSRSVQGPVQGGAGLKSKENECSKGKHARPTAHKQGTQQSIQRGDG